MTALVRPPCTTELTNGLCVFFPCFAVPYLALQYLYNSISAYEVIQSYTQSTSYLYSTYILNTRKACPYTQKYNYDIILCFSTKKYQTTVIAKSNSGKAVAVRCTVSVVALFHHASCQPPCFEVDARKTQDLRRRTEIIPLKDFHSRIKPLALASGHGRYITVTPERTLVSVGEWPLHIAVTIFNRFTSEAVS